VRQTCLQSGKKLTIRQKIKLSDLLTNRQYFTILTYSEETTNVPEISDNKIQVLTEKVSYHVGEKARVLVRLPFSHGKILWTVEKK